MQSRIVIGAPRLAVHPLALPVVPRVPSVQHTQQSRPDVTVNMGRRSDKIALRKSKTSAKKAKVYGRIGKKIVSVVKAGGADPVGNVKLAELLKLAKDLNVPKDILERNIKRATDKSQSDYLEICYEAYGPGGTAFIVECLTDNVNRTAGEVKSAINKSGCKVADPGSVMFGFQRAGLIYVVSQDENAVFEAAMDAGAEDIIPAPPEEEGEQSPGFKVFTSVEAWVGAKAQIAAAGFTINEEESSLIYKANAEVDVDDDAFAKCEALLERLLEVDDVDGVYSNCEGLDA